MDISVTKGDRPQGHLKVPRHLYEQIKGHQSSHMTQGPNTYFQIGGRHLSFLTSGHVGQYAK